MKALYIANLTKKYDSKIVLDAVNLNVEEGEFYALMGPNGSGKTTLASIVATVRRPNSGIVEIFEKKPEDAKGLIGYIPQENFSSPKLTGRENLIYFANLLGYPLSKAKDLATGILERIGLSADADKRVNQYSGGMRKRLEVATAFFPGIKLLILDEPTTGLDPSARRSFFEMLNEIGSGRISILLITHIGSDAELASKVGLIDEGKIVAEGTPEELKRTHTIEDVVTVETAVRNDRVADLLNYFSHGQRVSEIGNRYRIYVQNGDKVLADIVRNLDQAGYRVLRIEMARPTLEDVFFKLTQKTVREV
jgi:ABC-2 type transport system ATP-binding protein